MFSSYLLYLQVNLIIGLPVSTGHKSFLPLDILYSSKKQRLNLHLTNKRPQLSDFGPKDARDKCSLKDSQYELVSKNEI